MTHWSNALRKLSLPLFTQDGRVTERALKDTRNICWALLVEHAATIAGAKLAPGIVNRAFKRMTARYVVGKSRLTRPLLEAIEHEVTHIAMVEAQPHRAALTYAAIGNEARVADALGFAPADIVDSEQLQREIRFGIDQVAKTLGERLLLGVALEHRARVSDFDADTLVAEVRLYPELSHLPRNEIWRETSRLIMRLRDRLVRQRLCRHHTPQHPESV